MNEIRILLVFCCLSLALAPRVEAGEGHSAATGGPTYVRLKPISFSVIGEDNKIDKEVSIMLDLELEQDKTEAMLDPYKRRLLDAFLVMLNQIYAEHQRGDPPVGGEEIKARLLETTTGIVGPGIVHGILIMSIGERGQAR